MIKLFEEFSKGEEKNKYNSNGQKEGYWETIFGHDCHKGYFSNGIREGSWEVYIKNNIISKYNYKNGVLDGYTEKYDENGDLLCVGNFKNGERTGHWVYYKDGDILKKGNLFNMIEVGYWEYYNNGYFDHEHLYLGWTNRYYDIEKIGWLKLTDFEIKKIRNVLPNFSIEEHEWYGKIFYLIDDDFNFMFKVEDDYYYIFRDGVYTKYDQLSELIKGLKKK